MSGNVRIEPQGDREYLVRFPAGEGEVESLFRATEATLDELRIPGADELRIVEETAAFLLARQPVIDIPSMIDLDDVTAHYGDDYLDELRRRLG
jgi:hypothetical protein